MTSPTDRKHEVARISAALQAAIADRRMELAGHSIFYYFDNDTVLGAFFSLNDLVKHGINEFNRTAFFVRAFWTCGHLGVVHMLWPHLMELNSNLRTTRDTTIDVATLEEFFAKYGLADLSRRLEETRGDGATADPLVAELKDLHPDSFILLESRIGRTWEDRLSDMSSYLDLRNGLGKPAKELADTDAFHTFALLISEKRGETILSRNTLSDAAALASLTHMVEQHRADPEKHPAVRFYTQTNAVRDACLDKKAILRLYSAIDPKRPVVTPSIDDDNFILRSPEYFLLRAVFPCLATSTAPPPPSPATVDQADSFYRSVSLDDLDKLSRQLDAILTYAEYFDFDWEGIVAHLKNLKVKQKPVNTLLEEFNSQAVQEAVWADPRDLALQRLRKLGVLDVEAITKEWKQGVRPPQSGADPHQIRRDLAQWEHFSKYTQVLGKAADAKSSQTKSQPDSAAVHELGLLRWAHPLDDAHRKTLTKLVARILDREPKTRTEAALESANLLGTESLAQKLYNPQVVPLVADASNEQNILVVACVAWILERYEVVAEVVNEHASTARIPELHLIRLAALLMNAKDEPDRRPAAPEIITAAEKALDLVRNQPPRLAWAQLSAAWTMYYAWYAHETDRSHAAMFRILKPKIRSYIDATLPAIATSAEAMQLLSVLALQADTADWHAGTAADRKAGDGRVTHLESMRQSLDSIYARDAIAYYKYMLQRDAVAADSNRDLQLTFVGDALSRYNYKRLVLLDRSQRHHQELIERFYDELNKRPSTRTPPPQ